MTAAYIGLLVLGIAFCVGGQVVGHKFRYSKGAAFFLDADWFKYYGGQLLFAVGLFTFLIAIECLRKA